MPGPFMPAEDATAALLQACTTGKPDCRLLDQWLLMGANINAHVDNGKTPLMLASQLGDAEVVAFLLNNGASVNQQNPLNGQTALMMAAWAGHADTVVYLLQKGALINVADTTGRTALAKAKDDARTVLLQADAGRLQAEAARTGRRRLQQAVNRGPRPKL